MSLHCKSPAGLERRRSACHVPWILFLHDNPRMWRCGGQHPTLTMSACKAAQGAQAKKAGQARHAPHLSLPRCGPGRPPGRRDCGPPGPRTSLEPTRFIVRMGASTRLSKGGRLQWHGSGAFVDEAKQQVCRPTGKVGQFSNRSKDMGVTGKEGAA